MYICLKITSNNSGALLNNIDELLFTIPHLLLNERVWSNAFSKQPRNDDSRKQSKWATFIGYLQFVYEKSRVHYLFPIILLFAYSLLGGLIFWSIEKSHEEVILRDKTVYWYTLTIFYLTENETHKAMALRPQNAESMWRQHFESNFGRIHALRNYTDQLALRCWEIGVEGSYMGWQRPLYRQK
ncbi:hypothetical protein NECAME_14234, partial [Necator americanus]